MYLVEKYIFTFWQKARNYGYLLASSSFIATSFELSTDGSFLESAENEWDLKTHLITNGAEPYSFKMEFDFRA